ncbi:hypothetical protein E2553_36950 [Paraburkholderia dipogonis]|uniref:Shufflon system plasmid conjugative transfer pilus tip adhesin PilV n=1 Tax=Paraburkholderia dipogonis TaxID=1211383 RepID=A0A4Y8MHK6_9BURK|nr:hypothetical protein [Paraburkholderia dipogonis]TFE36970.1 hypothetical protein E2553_45955 [Paraburkholderia dipogonis]TFE38367.1 hypothetical protein E2553_36950 [Paraburkholderia dipogonis]
MGSLLEMMFVLLGSAILTVQGIKLDIEHQRATMLALEGQNEATLVTAFQGYISDNFGTILTQYTASGNNATITPPTIAQLVAAGSLKQAHKNGPYWGGAYVTTMTMVPSGCTQTAGNCHVAFTMYPTTQLLKGGKPDVAGAAQIALAGSKLTGTSQFGYSNAQSPAQITGINGSFTASNPLGSKAASIMATNGPDTDGNSVYIRRDGSLTWTGDQDVNNVSLRNVNDIKVQTLEASGAVSAASVAATGAVTAGSVAATGAVTAATMTATGTIRGNSVTSATTMQAGNIAVPRAACAPNGLTASNSDGSGQQLTCQYGIWLPTGGRLLRTGYYPVSDGSNVSKPTCPSGGTAIIELSPQGWYVDTTATVNYNAYDYGSYWNIRITDGAGGGISGSAAAGTYCSY